MRTCKAKAIQVDLGIFAHILSYSGIFIFRTLLYLERWYIQNSGIFRTWHIENQKHIENPPWYIQNPGILRAQVHSLLWHVENSSQFQNPVKHLCLSVLQKQLSCKS